MKHFYSVPAATLAANPPQQAIYHATACPGLPTFCIVLVELWDTHAAQDAWEAIPGIQEHHIETMGLPAPAGVVTAFAPWGATLGMTLRQVFGVIRSQWPVWRH